MTLRDKKSPAEAWRTLKKARERTAAVQKNTKQRKKLRALSSTTLYEYCERTTHSPKASEKRSRKQILSKADVVTFMRARRSLIKRAKGVRRVTYADVIKEAKVGFLVAASQVPLRAPSAQLWDADYFLVHFNYDKDCTVLVVIKWTDPHGANKCSSRFHSLDQLL